MAIIMLLIADLQGSFAVNANDEFAVKILQEAESLTKKLPKESQGAVLAKIAAEYQRFGRDADATTLWVEMEQSVEKSSDREFCELLLTAMAVQKTRVGEFENGKTLLQKIEDAPTRHRAIQQVARELCDQGKFKEGVEFAESIPRNSRVLFDAMEEIGLAAAKGGDTKSAARASRGMNPGMGGSMARKLRTVSRMCNSYWKTGNEKSAIPFMGQGKKFSDIIKLDLESTLIIDTTWAALQADDFESELKKLLDVLKKDKSKVDKDEVRLSMASVVLSFDHVDLIKHFRHSNEESSYNALLDLQVAHHFANSGKTDPTLKAIEKVKHPILAAECYVKLSRFHLDEKNLEEAQKHLIAGKPLMREFFKKETQPDYFWGVFQDYVSACASAKLHRDALALVRQLKEPKKVPELMVQIVISMK